MFVCPTCGEEFATSEQVAKHYLKCWKDTHRQHSAKCALKKEDIINSVATMEVAEFFQFLEGK